MQFVKATRLINSQNRKEIVRLGVNEHMFDVATYEKKQGRERKGLSYLVAPRHWRGVGGKIANTS